MKDLKVNIISLLIITGLITGCAMNVPEKGYEYLAPPVITNHYRDGDKIIIEFIGYNDEYYFDGYNVYVSDSSLNRNSVALYKPVQLEDYPSSTPSFPLSPDDYDSNEVRSVTLYQYYWVSEGEHIPYPFSEDTSYYIFLCSHHRLGYIFPEGVSNQVTSNAVAR